MKFLPLNDILRPSQTAFFLDSSGSYANGFTIASSTSMLTTTRLTSGDVGTVCWGVGGTHLRHREGEGYNTIFFDGHSQSNLFPDVVESTDYYWLKSH